MNVEAIWEVFIRFVWPLALAYAAYIHTELNRMMKKFEDLQVAHQDQVAKVNRDFATKLDLTTLETRLTAVLVRIDDKVTRILEREAK